MKRLVEKADLQNNRKADLIDTIVANGLVKDIRGLKDLTYDELVDIIVDSKKFYRIELEKKEEENDYNKTRNKSIKSRARKDF
jgi:hypothetical protein